eukprot:6492471-Amphidinium_carterae.1
MSMFPTRLPSGHSDCSALVSVAMGLNEAVKQETTRLMQRKRSNAEDTASMEKWAQSFSVEQLTQILAQRKVFQDMCSAEGVMSQSPAQATSLPWAAFPGACPTLVACTTAEHAARGQGEAMHQDAYKSEQQWQSLHAVLPAAPKRRIPTTTTLQCLFGVCVCKKKFHPVGVVKTRAKQFIDSLDAELVNTGAMVLTWQCYLMDDQNIKACAGEGVPAAKLVTHLSYCSWRPFRPVFLVLEEVMEDEHCFRQCWTETNQPRILTLFEVLYALDSNTCWDVAAHCLSNSHSAVSSLNGRVWVDAAICASPVRIWHGDAVEWSTHTGGGGRGKVHELLLAKM